MTETMSAEKTMQAVTYDRYSGPEVLRVTEISRPVPGPDQVLVRVTAASINAADYRLMRADPFLARFHSGLRRPNRVPVLGSDFAGVVDEVGSDVSAWSVGDRVYGDSFPDGRAAFAEYVCIPAQNAYKIPDEISDDIASILDPLGNAVHTALSYDLVGEDVLITGAGPIGLMATAVARHVGARHVVITDINEKRLAMADQFGASRTVIAGLVGAALAALVAWFLASRLSRPVKRLTEAAEHVAATQDLSASIATEGRDEVIRLQGRIRTIISQIREIEASNPQTDRRPD